MHPSARRDQSNSILAICAHPYSSSREGVNEAPSPAARAYWVEARVIDCPEASTAVSGDLDALTAANVVEGGAAATTSKVDPVPSNPSTKREPELSVKVPPLTQIFQ